MLDNADVALMDNALTFASAVSVGLAVGTERSVNNRAQTDRKTSMRDFSLVSVLAYVSGVLSSSIPMAWLVSLIGVIAFALMTYFLENRRSEESVGMTTLISLPVTYMIASLPGFGAPYWTTATVVFVTLLLLGLKEHVRNFLNTLHRQEVIDLALLIGIAITVTPLISDSAKLPIPLLDFSSGEMHVIVKTVAMHSLWKVVVMVSLMSFFAHFITKYAKGKNALVLATFFGGLVSSLATIVMVLNNGSQREGSDKQPLLSRREIFLGFVSANTGSILKDIAVLRMVVGEEKFSGLVGPMVVMLLLFLTITAYAFSNQKETAQIRITHRPLPLGFIFKFSGIVAVLLVIMTMVTFYLGNEALVPASFMSALVSSAAAMTSIGAAMVQEGGVSTWIAGLGVIAAMTGSVGAKYMVVVRKLGFRESFPFLAPIAGLISIGVAALWISLH